MDTKYVIIRDIINNYHPVVSKDITLQRYVLVIPDTFNLDRLLDETFNHIRGCIKDDTTPTCQEKVTEKKEDVATVPEQFKDQYYTTDELANRLKLNFKYVSKYARKNNIKPMKIGVRAYYPKEKADALIEERKKSKSW